LVDPLLRGDTAGAIENHHNVEGVDADAAGGGGEVGFGEGGLCEAGEDEGSGGLGEVSLADDARGLHPDGVGRVGAGLSVVFGAPV